MNPDQPPLRIEPPPITFVSGLQHQPPSPVPDPVPQPEPDPAPEPITFYVSAAENALLTMWLQWHGIPHTVKPTSTSSARVTVPPNTRIGLLETTKVPIDKAWPLLYAAFTRPASIDLCRDAYPLG